ncbi:MAG: glycosyltransferase [Sedimentisphaerales bacterium]
MTLALLWARYDGKITSVNDLVLRLDRERFNVIFIFLRGDTGEENLLREAGYKVLYLSSARRLKAFHPSVALRLINLLKEHKVDVLHCHAHKATVYGTLAGALAGTPIVLAQVHGLGRSRNLRRKLINLLLFRRIDRVICVADAVKKDVLSNNWCLSAAKTFVLENSVDYGRFADVSISKADARKMLGVPEDAFVFGTAGRLAPTKGLTYLMEAFSKVKTQQPSAQLVLLGDGPSRAELEGQVSSLPCRDSIHLLGHRGGIEQLMRGMDVFVLPSVAEGMPRVILEAMASGVPCIAPAVGGIPEIINSREVGLLAPPKDPEALARAMIAVAGATDEERERVIQNARHRVRQLYAHEVIAEKLKNLYESRFSAYCKAS